MKKLIIAAAIVCAAACVQASTVIWGLSGNVDDTTYASGTAYLVCVNDLARPTFSDDAGAATWYTANGSSLASKAFRSVAVADGAVYETETDVTSPTGRKNYWLAIVSDDGEHIAVSTTTKALNITTSSLNITAVWTASSQMGSYSVVPEPTSALLMLLGMCGLALRRRRA